MDLDTALKVATVAFAIGSAVYSWIASRDKATAASLATLEKEMSAHADRLTKIEADVQHLPDKDTSHRMEIAIAEMRGEMRVLAERLMPVAAIADRLQEFLLEQASRR